MSRHVLLLAGALALLPGGCFEDPTPAENLAAVINSIDSEGEPILVPLPVREGEQVTLTLRAWDPNGDPLLAENIAWETTDGSIVGSGPQVRFEPPNVIWEVPPQRVLVTVTVSVSDGRADPAVHSVEIEVLPPCRADDQKPVINTISATPEAIRLGERSTILIDAHDPEGKPLTYEWSPPFGYIEGTGEQVDWVTTEVCCTDWYDVEVVVSDGCKTAWGFVSVHVTI